MNTVNNNIESNMNNVNNVINGTIFVVPNQLATPASIGWAKAEDWNEWVEDIRPYLKAHGMEPEEKMVQVWATNPVVDNFCDHWDDYQVKILGKTEEDWNCKPECPDSFPSHLPLSLFEGKKEGDTITLRREDGVVLNLELAQKRSRYARFGNFEDILKHLIEYTNSKEATKA